MTFEETCKKAVLYISAALLTAAAVYVFLKYVAVLFLPFAIALFTEFATRPIKRYICARSRMPEKTAATVAVAVILALITAAVVFLCRRAVSELVSVYTYLGEHSDLYAVVNGKITEIADRLSSFIPYFAFPHLEQSDKLAAVLAEIAPVVTSRLGEAAAGAARCVPQCLVFAAMTLVSSFYFAADLDKICAFFVSLVPKKVADAAGKTKRRMARAMFKYLKAYLLILTITFTELYVGFSLLKVPYSLSLSVIIAIVDILPVLGTGTVLLPWSAASFLLGDSYMGVGILALYIVISFVRQVAEPRIVGKSIGLYPPLTLIGMYVGVKLFGFSGIFLGPFAVIALKSALTAHTESTVSENNDAV